MRNNNTLAYILAAIGVGLALPVNKFNSLQVPTKKLKTNNNRKPHQGAKECARRVRTCVALSYMPIKVKSSKQENLK